MYSLGYINTMINSILENINEEEKVKQIQERIEKDRQEYTKIVNEVVKENESETRNKEKLERFGLKSRFGKKFDFDMLEESGEDN